MHKFARLILIALACAIQGALHPRIIGGKNAADGKYPHQVSIKCFGWHFCGGSIINARNVLTAAHCIHGSESSVPFITVHAGTNLLNETGYTYGVANVSVHKDYNPFYITDDVAVLHLNTSIIYTSAVQPIRLSRNDKGRENKTCTLIGWGLTNLDGSTPNRLQEIDLIVYPQDKCKAAQWGIKDEHICTLTKQGEGACSGDSGGSLLANGIQIGIVSFGTPCARGYPDVYTRVSKYRKWIKAHLVK